MSIFLNAPKALSKAVGQASGFTGTTAAFYQQWWSGVPSSQLRAESVTQALHPPHYSLQIESHIHGEVQSIGSQLVLVEPGEYYSTSDTSRVILRWKSWSSEEWNWYQSSSPRPYPRCSHPKRIYIPSSTGRLPKFAVELAEQLDEQSLYFILKARKSDGLFRDSVVVYSDEASARSIASAIARMNLEYSLEPPPLAKYWQGIGIVDDRLDGESVGWVASRLIWKATRSGSPEDSLAVVSREYAEPDKPWVTFSQAKAFWDWLEING